MKFRTLIPLLLLTILPVACIRDHAEPCEASPQLYITLEVPAPAAVKGETVPQYVPATTDESRIHDLMIWVFENGKDAQNNDTHTYLTSLELNSASEESEFPQPGTAKRYSLDVSKEFARKSPRPTVDVFVLANASSLGLSLTPETPWQTLWDACFGGIGKFSPNNENDRIHTVPSGGLPMSGYRTLTVSGQEPTLSVATIPLTRAVSKIRFVFSQTTQSSNTPASELEVMRIDSVVIGGSLIPVDEYVFCDTPPRVGGTYVTGTTRFEHLGNSDFSSISIPKIDAPELYSYAGQSGPVYEQLLKDAIDGGKIADFGTTYLRESDKPLTGTVYYTVSKGGVPQPQSTATFNMTQDSNFPRNHTWTLYGYFVSKRTLQLSVSVVPWDKTDTRIEFSEQALVVTTKFTVRIETVSSITRVTGTDDYIVQMKDKTPAKAYLKVAAPEGGFILFTPQGTDNSESYFTVKPEGPVPINPHSNNGEIDVEISRKTAGVGSGKRITIGISALTPDQDREISGASEAIDQNYIFVLP